MIEQQNIEFDLLRYLARVRVNPERVEHIHHLCSDGVRWEHVRFLAQMHRVVPLLNHALGTLNLSSVATETIDILAKRAQGTNMFNEFLVQELGRLVTHLESSGINTLALKGPVLAQEAYGNTALRSFGDLDILVDPSSFNAAREVLKSKGYRDNSELRDYSPVQERIYLWQDNQYPMTRGAGVFHVDLHRRVMPPLYTYRNRFDQLYTRSKLILINGAEVRTFAPEDDLLILCYHGIKNRWSVLRYVCDVAETIEANQDLNWDDVLDRAGEAGGLRILFLGLRLAHDLLGARLPESVLDQISKVKTVCHRADDIHDRMARVPYNSSLGFLQRSLLQLAAQDNWTNRVRYGNNALLRRLGDVFLP